MRPCSLTNDKTSKVVHSSPEPFDLNDQSGTIQECENRTQPVPCTISATAACPPMITSDFNLSWPSPNIGFRRNRDLFPSFSNLARARACILEDEGGS